MRSSSCQYYNNNNNSNNTFKYHTAEEHIISVLRKIYSSEKNNKETVSLQLFATSISGLASSFAKKLRISFSSTFQHFVSFLVHLFGTASFPSFLEGGGGALLKLLSKKLEFFGKKRLNKQPFIPLVYNLGRTQLVPKCINIEQISKSIATVFL